MIPELIRDLSRNGGTSLRWMSLLRRDLRPEGRPAVAGQVPNDCGDHHLSRPKDTLIARLLPGGAPAVGPRKAVGIESLPDFLAFQSPN